MRDMLQLKQNLARVLTSMSLVEISTLLVGVADELQARNLPVQLSVREASVRLDAYRRELVKQRHESN